ncbi:MAG: hypothetical protein LQ340_002987 [Diploschistes diacapsis]|nr:MAG: hypothetical protein LQ340_002987 [Diploschistes diacapsis]
MDVDDNASRNDMEMEIDGHETVGDVAVADVMAMAMANNVANAASGEADYGDTNGVGSGPSHFQDQEQQQQQQQQQQQHLMPTLTNGVSVGVQSDKVTNLGPETAVLNIVGKNLTQATWNPKHPTLLAAGGKALCQIWALDQQSYANSQSGIAAATEASGTATPTATTNGATTSHNNLAVSPSDTTELEIDGAASVTAMAWSPSGDHIAYSSFPSSNTLVQRSITTVWSKEGFVEEQLPSGTEPVVGLAWSPTGRYLAAISGKSLVVLDKKMSEVLPACETKGSLLDVVWLDQGPQLAVCGESIIAITGIAENRITDPLELSQSEVNHDWTQMQYDTHTSTIAVASEESGYLALVEGAGPLRPMAGSDAISSTARRLLATSSVDGTVKLWNGRAGLQHVHTFNLGAPALSLCFTPDGRHVAAASCSKILFWSAQEGCLPKAIWESPHIHQHARHLEGTNYTNGTNGVENGDVDMEDDLSVPSLTWDSNGHKLALACKDKRSTSFTPVKPSEANVYLGNHKDVPEAIFERWGVGRKEGRRAADM